VNILQRFKISRELARLEKKARETPSPSTYVDMAQVYINLGMVDQTLRVAEEGLALFPASEELKRVLKFAKKSKLNHRIRDLRSRINKQPAPVLYRELASIYMELGDFGSVQGTCEECLRRFPEDDGAWLVLARARLKNFYRDLTAQDGLEAVRCLKKALSLNPASGAALRLLAEVCYRVGAIGQAQEYLEKLRGMFPGEKEVEALWQEVSTKTSREDDLEVLFRAVEEKGALAYGPPGSGPRSYSLAPEQALAGIKKSLAQIASVQGVQKAAYIKGSKALVRGEICDARDPFLRAARVIARSAQRASRRMDIGNFNKGIVEGPFGHFLICCLGDVTSSVLLEKGARVDRVLSLMQDMVASSLYVANSEGGR